MLVQPRAPSPSDPVTARLPPNHICPLRSEVAAIAFNRDARPAIISPAACPDYAVITPSDRRLIRLLRHLTDQLEEIPRRAE
jgi:hypothetical protein